MDLASHFPMWNKLTSAQQTTLTQSAVHSRAKAGTILHHGSSDCMGLLLIKSGQLRAYILSDEGREITLYRLFDMDICLFSASCVMQSVQFDLIIEAEKDTDFCIIPPQIYKHLLEESAPMANYANEIMASRFSEVMWLIEQIMWKSFDKRLAGFLLDETRLENTSILKITHEKIANHLGTAREVVTRMLRYFQSEEIVSLTRGTVEVIDKAKLTALLNS